MKQIDPTTQECFEEFSTVHFGFIFSICSNNKSNILFSADDEGKIKQWNFYKKKPFELSSDWNKVHKNAICSMCLTKDSKYLFSSDDTDPSDLPEDKRNKLGNLKKFAVGDKELVCEYERNSKENVGAIKCMTLSNDENSLFVTDSFGNIEQWSATENKMLHDFGRMHKYGINSIFIHNNNIYTCDNKGGLLVISLKTKEKIQEFLEVVKIKFTTMCLC